MHHFIRSLSFEVTSHKLYKCTFITDVFSNRKTVTAFMSVIQPPAVRRRMFGDKEQRTETVHIH